MEKLRETTGAVSRREVLLVVLIVVMALFFILEGVQYLNVQQRKGDDALRENTALSVARANSNFGLDCPVTDCPGGECPHFDGERYAGYYDDLNNSIIGDRPAGYNEADTMTIEETTWHGEPGTMVIRVVVEEDEIHLNWEKGRG